MTNELIKSLFRDKEIRIVEQDGDFWMPVKDIAEAIGYNHLELINMINRNSEFFDGYTRNVLLMIREKMTEFEIRQNTLKCVNEQGFYMMISKISLNHIESDETRSAVIEFNRHMVSEMKRIRQERQSSQTKCHGDFFKQEYEILKIINEEIGIDKTLLMVTAFERTEHFTGIDMSHYRNMLPAPKGVIAVLRATDIGKELGVDASSINIVLKELGFHKKERYGNKNVWKLTKEGEKYGKAFYEAKQHKNTGHWEGFINKWSPEVIDLIKVYLEDHKF